MQVKTYDILYILNGKEKKIECSKYSLQKYINEFVLKGGKVLQIITHNQNKVIQKPNNSIKKDIHKYYNNKYTSYYRQYVTNKISKECFYQNVTILKKLKKESKNKEELERKFEKYKKAGYNSL